MGFLNSLHKQLTWFPRLEAHAAKQKMSSAVRYGHRKRAQVCCSVRPQVANAFQGHGFLGMPQLEATAKYVILHRQHPDIGSVASVALVEERRSLDYPTQERWHEVTIAALGSLGVTANYRKNQPNTHELLEFVRKGEVGPGRRE